jgi:hypothetical protein
LLSGFRPPSHERAGGPIALAACCSQEVDGRISDTMSSKPAPRSAASSRSREHASRAATAIRECRLIAFRSSIAEAVALASAHGAVVPGRVLMVSLGDRLERNAAAQLIAAGASDIQVWTARSQGSRRGWRAGPPWRR